METNTTTVDGRSDDESRPIPRGAAGLPVHRVIHEDACLIGSIIAAAS